MQQLYRDLKDKYQLARDTMKENDPSNYFTLDKPHLSWCTEKTHKNCWLQGTRARIVLRACGRFLYLITGEAPVYCDIKTKPKLPDIIKYIAMNHEDISNENYQQLMGFQNEIRGLNLDATEQKKKRL